MKVKLDLRSIPDNELGAFAQKIVTGLTGNAAVPNPNPSIADLTTMLANFNAAFSHYDAARNALAELVTLKDNARVVLEAGLTTEGATVESQTGGSQAGIESVGMEVQAKPTRTTSLAAPAHFTVTMGRFPRRPRLALRRRSAREKLRPHDHARARHRAERVDDATRVEQQQRHARRVRQRQHGGGEARQAGHARVGQPAERRHQPRRAVTASGVFKRRPSEAAMPFASCPTSALSARTTAS